MDKNLLESYTAKLTAELIPAMGCTEPIAVAYAAAYAAKVLDEPFQQVRVSCSPNIFKNVKSVTIPNTGGMIGVEAAALAGAVAANPEKGLAVLNALTDEHRARIRTAHNAGICTANILESPHILHVIVELAGTHHTSKVELRDAHNQVVSVSRDGVEIQHNSPGSSQPPQVQPDGFAMTVESIKQYADTVAIEDIRPILDPQIQHNYAIALEGLAGDYGVNYARLILAEGDTLFNRIIAHTVAAAEARMAGCPLPVVITSGSGNQGLTSSVPVIVYCREQACSDEALFRALAFSNLLTIYQKQYIGRLSGFCGAISAASSSAAALTYLSGGTLEQIKNTITNTLAVTSGIICDGAKPSCAAKIASGLSAAIRAHQLAMNNAAYRPGEGILCEDADATIRAVGRIAREGMRETDREIIQVMLNHYN